MSGQSGIGGKYPDISSGTAAASPKDSVVIRKGIERVIEKREIEFQVEYQCTALTEPLWFRLHAAAFRFSDEDGEPMILVSHDDITSEKLVSESLVKDRERLTRLLTTTNIMPWEADAKSWLFTYVGEQAESIMGYPADDWFEPSFWTAHIHPHDRERAIAECTRLSQIKDHYQFEYRMIARDGRIIWISDVVNVHRENGQAVTMSGFMIDITDRKQTEDTLRLLGGRLITAQEEERKRIARDLHDDLNQRMALLSIDLEQTGQMLAAKSDGVAERVKGLQKKALGISREIHRMSYTLHPSKLDHLGLVPALKSFCSEIAESRGLKIDFRHEGFPATIPASVTLCVFRVAQEALQNAAKHSGVSTFDVDLKKSDRAVELTISDEGCGFDMDTDKMTVGLGFISMRERLRLVNGEITIQSKPSKGTRISIWVPLDYPFSGLPILMSNN
jgi:PAS domain S-box-containing protein